jgi:hypothetical protein
MLWGRRRAGLCPRSDESASKRRSTRLRKGALTRFIHEHSYTLLYM